MYAMKETETEITIDDGLSLDVYLFRVGPDTPAEITAISTLDADCSMMPWLWSQVKDWTPETGDTLALAMALMAAWRRECEPLGFRACRSVRVRRYDHTATARRTAQEEA